MFPTLSDLLFLFSGDFGKEDPTSSKGKQHAQILIVSVIVALSALLACF